MKIARVAYPLAISVLALSTGQCPAAGLSCKPLPAAGRVTSNPISCTVSCANGGTLAAALALRARTTSAMTITIEGVCSEAVDGVPDGITLQGAAAGDGLSAPSASANPVLGISGRGVTLTGLTISGGVNPLLVHKTGGVTGTNLVIENASAQDVFVSGSLTLNSSTVENSALDGVEAVAGGAVTLNGGTVQNNARRGIFADDNGSVFVAGGAVVSDNGSGGGSAGGGYAQSGGVVSVSDGSIEHNSPWGIATSNGGSVELDGNTAVVQSNTGDGVHVYGGSVQVSGGVVTGNSQNGISIYNSGTANLGVNADIETNSGDGVFVDDGTVAVGNLGGPATIQSNMGNGVYLATNSVAHFYNPGTGNQIISNGMWGILCQASPASPLIEGTTGTVSGNTSGQISCNSVP